MTAISITELGRIIEAGIEPERSFGWDAAYGPGAMFVPDLAEPAPLSTDDALEAIRKQMEDAA